MAGLDSKHYTVRRIFFYGPGAFPSSNQSDKEKAVIESGGIVLAGGLLIGLIYGAVGLLSGFCLLSALRGWNGDGRLIRAYALALSVAVAGTQFLAASGSVEFGKTIYLQSAFSVPMIFLGGALFGYGMVLANGCGSRALVLLGRGNLRSFVVIVVVGVVAQMVLKGLIAPPRMALTQATQITASAVSLPALLSASGFGDVFARMLAATTISVALLIFAFAHAPFRQSRGQIAAGLAVGLLVVAGWLVTGYFGADDFNPAPVTSLTFVAPVADSIQYAMLSTGLSASFGVMLVVGVVTGSLVTALATGRFQLEGYTSPQHMLRSIGGAALMGAGGAMALGCSVGQGLTGLSTLSLASFIAVAGILSGSMLGLRGAIRVRPLAVA